MPSLLSAQSLVWKVSGKGLSRASYVMGSIHLIPPALLAPDSVFSPLLDSVQTLITEIPLEMPPAEQESVVKSMVLSRGESYEKKLGAELWTQWKRYICDSLHIPDKVLAMYENIKPFYLSVVLLHDWMPNAVSVDEYVHILCKKRNIRNAGLETLQEQLQLMEAFTPEIQFQEFASPPSLKADYRNMLKMYRKANLDSLCAMEQKQLAGELLYKRNGRWLKQLPHFFESSPSLVCVGVAHLGGKDGVLEGLRELGYRVEPMTLKIPLTDIKKK